MKFKETVYGAFIFDRLIEKIKRIKRELQIRDLLLAVTRDPVIAVYHRFEAKKIRHAANLVYDYMSTDVGIVSPLQYRGEGSHQGCCAWTGT